ncbi:U32 family peptidase [Calothrix sp. 336/3]|uniref:U32 family peptidase n=1 Tax=Calothrix sp. 336/3 TaxID=1337936 RepID=UPI0004E43AC8|nr:U32 family peptidase [Calothrix sp. 336/3]AKG20273.1 peptidase U32 [Calothrix sp. 336/3]
MPVDIQTPQRPELLAPAGNWECAKAAVENGADAIYFGLDKFNARMRAENFTEADLPELMTYLHSRGVKGYVTLNTLIFPQELRAAQHYLRSIIAAGVDAVIVQDIGICRLIRHLSPDFPIHASTQMTITSVAGVEFAEELGCNLVVLARECSLKEIDKIQQHLAYRQTSLPLEVFVHGALCVAYSGQCLTSEALGGRSANRGECAQACRMPYELIADGETVYLGDKKYLLSPQDLAGLDVLPDLVKSGVSCLKIEGRLKSAEYVASVTRVYREALDRVEVSQNSPEEIPENLEATAEISDSQGEIARERYQLEMAFSRGLYTGWFGGINNQELVHARFGKKRGVYLGEVTRVREGQVAIKLGAAGAIARKSSLESVIKPGDGVVFDSGNPQTQEEGGRVYGVQQQGREAILTFGRDNVNWRRVQVGDKLWKTSDPELDKQVRQSFAGDVPQFQRPVAMEVYGKVGEQLRAIARDQLGNIVLLDSDILLVAAHTKPLTTEKLREQLGRLGNTSLRLTNLDNHLQGNVMLPVSELNRMRREIVARLEKLRSQPPRWQLNNHASLKDILPSPETLSPIPSPTNLIVLVRNLRQLQAILDRNMDSSSFAEIGGGGIPIHTIYCEFADQRQYRQAVKMVRERENSAYQIFVAPPRITKPGENWILQQVKSAGADGYLVRNYDHLQFFAGDNCVGDFSLNVANPLSADYLKNKYGLQRLTASYDLNIQQLTDLLQHTPPSWFEVTIHQHMPMFHMEHCVFCAFLSDGTDYTNCDRPCEKHQVKLRDRVGTEHILQADVGCRNTVFNGTAQTGAEYVQHLIDLGLRDFRIEFVDESPEEVQLIIHKYQQLLRGDISGSQLWRELKLQNQLGVTRGSIGAGHWKN